MRTGISFEERKERPALPYVSSARKETRPLLSRAELGL